MKAWDLALGVYFDSRVLILFGRIAVCLAPVHWRLDLPAPLLIGHMVFLGFGQCGGGYVAGSAR